MKSKSFYEEILAAELRARGIHFTRELRFDPTRMWRFDFAIEELKIGIEVEGGTWSGGAHTRPQGYEDDCEKYNSATLQGWRVLRFTSNQVRGVVDKQKRLKYRAIDIIMDVVRREERRARRQEEVPETYTSYISIQSLVQAGWSDDHILRFAEECDRLEAQAKGKRKTTHARPAGGSPQGRRQTLRQGQAQEDSRGEEVPSQGESPAPGDLQGKGQGEQRQA